METETQTSQVQTKPISARELHKYVWIADTTVIYKLGLPSY
jgi:hypothetical protein